MAFARTSRRREEGRGKGKPQKGKAPRFSRSRLLFCSQQEKKEKGTVSKRGRGGSSTGPEEGRVEGERGGVSLKKAFRSLLK